MTFHLFNQISLDLVPDGVNRAIIQFMFKAWIQRGGHLEKVPDLIILQNTCSLNVLTSHRIFSILEQFLSRCPASVTYLVALG